MRKLYPDCMLPRTTSLRRIPINRRCINAAVDRIPNKNCTGVWESVLAQMLFDFFTLCPCRDSERVFEKDDCRVKVSRKGVAEGVFMGPEDVAECAEFAAVVTAIQKCQETVLSRHRSRLREHYFEVGIFEYHFDQEGWQNESLFEICDCSFVIPTVQREPFKERFPNQF